MSITRKAAEIFGYDSKDVWRYRDTALAAVASIAALFFVGTLMNEFTDYNLKVCVGSLAVFMLCLALTPNRGLVFAVAVAMVATSGWYAVILKGESLGYRFAIPATIIVLVYLAMYWNRPLKMK